MGRHKIQIKKIENIKTRQITFNKRRTGLFKKAYELAALTSSSVTLLVRGENGKNYAFQSENEPIMEQLNHQYEFMTKELICDLSDEEELQKSYVKESVISSSLKYSSPPNQQEIQHSPKVQIKNSHEPPPKRVLPSLTIPTNNVQNDLFSPQNNLNQQNFTEIQSPMYFELNTPLVVDTPNGLIVVNTPKGGMAEKMLFPTE